MKTRLVIVVIFTTVLVFLLLDRPSPNSGKALKVISATPPIEQLRFYSITNGPRAFSGTHWTTNLSLDPRQKAVVELIRSMVHSNQGSRATVTSGKVGRGFRDAMQIQACQALQNTVGASLQVFLRTENSTPNHLKGRPLAKAISGIADPGMRNEVLARTFLQQNAALFLLESPDQELQLASRQHDELGGELLRFTQHYQGLKVWPAEIAVHLDGGGNIDQVDAAYVPTPKGITAQPALSIEEAEIKAKGAVQVEDDAVIDDSELVIYGPLNRPSRLAWKFGISAALNKAWWVLIDALNGQLLATISRVYSEGVNGSGVDLFGVTRPLKVWRSGSIYYMLDASKPMYNPAAATGFIEINDAANQTDLKKLYDVISTSAHSWSNPHAVSAAYNLSKTYDYWLERFGRSSYNGAGANILAIVRYPTYNAFFDSIHKYLTFGSEDYFAAALDVVGHEFAHAVIHSQEVLFYIHQSGALNEAFADIFGEMVEAYVFGTNDWLVGTNLRAAFRNMSNPPAFQQPADMGHYVVTEEDQGGVHINCGIINRAFYLLSTGLRGAIGRQAAERIFYRCLLMSMRPYSQFIDARLGCIAAAEALYGVGSHQALKTAEAFDAVGIFAAPASPPPPRSDLLPIDSPDSLFFIRQERYWDIFWYSIRDTLARYEYYQGDPPNGRKLVNFVNRKRPAITGSGSHVMYFNNYDSLYYMPTAGGSPTKLYSADLAHSVAVSPDFRYFAFVPETSSGKPTNQIIIFDFNYDPPPAAVINLVTPVSDGPPLKNIKYADALTFSPGGHYLVYDALSSFRGANGRTNQAWSIFALDMNTLQQRVIVPPYESWNIGNPSFSRISDNYIVLEALYTNGNSAIITFDLFKLEPGLIAVSSSGLGYPCFNGSDSLVFFADVDRNAEFGRSIFAQPISPDRLSPVGLPFLYIRNAEMAVAYRRGIPRYNLPPQVYWVSPPSGANYDAPASLLVAVQVTDFDNSVDRVEFYEGTKLLWTSTAAPYGFQWWNLTPGVYNLYARAYDYYGASTTSPPLRFSVTPAKTGRVMLYDGTLGFQFSLRLPREGLYRLEASSNLLNWESLGTFYCTTNLGYVDWSMTNYPHRFYRATITP